MGQRTAIKFCVKLKKTATETFQMLESAYGEECLSKTSVLMLTFLFPKLKIVKKWTGSEALSSIRQTVQGELKTIQQVAFSQAVDSLYERCKRCAESGGDYIQRWY
jgi:hypothetical protein